MDIKPKTAKLIYQRAMQTDVEPAAMMYLELLRSFGQVKLGMQLICTKVDWLSLDDVIEKCLDQAIDELRESCRFTQEVEEILDMVFNSPHYGKVELIRCFQTERERFVVLLMDGLTKAEQKLLGKLIEERLEKLEQ